MLPRSMFIIHSELLFWCGMQNAMQTLRTMFPNSNIYTDRNGQVVIQTGMSYDSNDGELLPMHPCKLCDAYTKHGEYVCADCDQEMEYESERLAMQYEAVGEDSFDDSVEDRYEAMDQSEK